MKTKKETALNEALRAYQIERPKKMNFWYFCRIRGYVRKMTKEEIKEAKEISKKLKV